MPGPIKLDSLPPNSVQTDTYRTRHGLSPEEWRALKSKGVVRCYQVKGCWNTWWTDETVIPTAEQRTPRPRRAAAAPFTGLEPLHIAPPSTWIRVDDVALELEISRSALLRLCTAPNEAHPHLGPSRYTPEVTRRGRGDFILRADHEAWMTSSGTEARMQERFTDELADANLQMVRDRARFVFPQLREQFADRAERHNIAVSRVFP